MLAEADPKKNVIEVPRKKRLVLFDFDGTITTRDTLAEIMIYFHGKAKYTAGLLALSPIMAMYLVKMMPNWKAKQYLLSWFFKGQNAAAFNERCMTFAREVIPTLVRPGALEMIRHYKSTGATIAVVTASAENWVKPWCDDQAILCLGTRLQVNAGKITGVIEGKNCHGAEKVCRIKDHFNISSYDEIIAYGDTSGDKEMLALAHQQHYKPFRTKTQTPLSRV